MMTNTAIVAAAWALWMAWGGVEELRARRRLAAIRHRVLCGGIRGKSTMTRLMHAGLRAAGLETLGRVTGGDPLLLMPNGREALHVRRGPANIREVRALLGSKLAARFDAVVIENMAIEPELQGIVARRFVRPTLQLFACDAMDHLEILPADPAARTVALLEGFDPGAPLVVSDYAENRTFSDLAAARGFRLVALDAPDNPIDPTDQANRSDLELPPLRPHIAPLADCVLRALRHLECLTPESRNAVVQRAAELQPLTVYRLGDSAWVNLLAANDPDSARRLIEGVLAMDRAKEFARSMILFNHRHDRPLRLTAFVPLLGEFESVIVGGRIAGRHTSRIGASWAPAPPADWARGANLIFLTGNAGGSGQSLCARLAAEGTVERW